MKLKHKLQLYFITLAIFLGLDFLWLGALSEGLYSDKLKDFIATSPNYLVAFLFYALFVVGLLIFVVFPAIKKASVAYAVKYGALFGLMTYATFDLSSLASFKNWPVSITFIDITWGVVLCSVVSFLSFMVSKRFKITIK